VSTHSLQQNPHNVFLGKPTKFYAHKNESFYSKKVNKLTLTQ